MSSYLSPTELSLRAKIAANDRHGHGAVADQYRRELAKVRTARDLDAHVARLVDAAPALTDDQLDRLRSVLHSPPSRTRAEHQVAGLVDAETGTTRKTPPAAPTGPSHQLIEPDTDSTTSLTTGKDGGGHD